MNKFFRSIGSFSLGPMVGAILSFFTVPIITHFISPDEYGKASMFILAQSTISAVIYLGMDQAFVREFNLMKDNIHKLMINAMLVPLSLSVAFGIASLVFMDKVSHILFGTYNERIAVFALSLLLPFMIIETFALLKIRMEERGLLYSTFTIILKAIVLVLTVVLFLLYEKSFRSVVYAAALGEIITGLILYFVVIRKYRFRRTLLDKGLQHQMLKFGLPLVPAFAVGWILTSMDKVMLRTMCTYDELGLYSAAFKIVSILSVLQACFTLYWTPVAYRWYQEGKPGRQYEMVSKIVAILMTIVCLGILLFKEIVAIILGAEFKSAISIFPFLLLFPVLYTLSETTGIGIGFRRKTVYNIVVTSIAGASNIALNYMLIPLLNGTGAAMATGLSYIAFFWGRTLISRRLWHKFDIKIYLAVNVIVLVNCTVHTFVNGYVPYLITFLFLIALAGYVGIYIRRFNLIGRLKNGEF